ncbi:SDR family NAD(P)-dependent oxidoreductase [Pseudactinotalea sp.]|uniref:SDR family NAD(P)-dependent oxidoreductase n=1 Tax=Pseudactinotalea sp. TaxID=1926260 RepID=UPI003B3AA287
MGTTVITGGTNGIGAALAGRLARAGHRVLVVGRSPTAPAGAELVRADLSTIAGTLAAATEVAARAPAVDRVVLGAGRFNRRRVLTTDGLEHTFALYPVSRYLFTDALMPHLSGGAVIVSVCGVGGLGGAGIQWYDLTLARSYRAFGAVSQVARASELLGAGFHDHYPASPARYVLYNPMFVDSGLGQQVGGFAGRALDGVARLFAQSSDDAAALIQPFLDGPSVPSVPLTASRRGKPMSLDRPEFDRAAAARLYRVLAELTSSAR